MNEKIVTRAGYGQPWHKATRYHITGRIRTECGRWARAWWSERLRAEVAKDEARCTKCFKEAK